MIHVRYEGRSFDINEMNLNFRAVNMNDEQIKEQVARHLEVGKDKLNFYVVDRTQRGDIVVRPEAVYG